MGTILKSIGLMREHIVCIVGARETVGAHFFVLKFKILVSSLSLGKKSKKKLLKK
jgi:hypothetical protein